MKAKELTAFQREKIMRQRFTAKAIKCLNAINRALDRFGMHIEQDMYDGTMQLADPDGVIDFCDLEQLAQRAARKARK